MSINQLIIVNEKHQEIARHELTDREAENLCVHAPNHPDAPVLFALHQSPLRMDWDRIFRDYRNDTKRQPILRKTNPRAAGNTRRNAQSSGRRHQTQAAGNVAAIGGQNESTASHAKHPPNTGSRQDKAGQDF